MPARTDKGEPDHFRLSIGHAFTTECADVGQIREAEVTGAARAPLADAETAGRFPSRIARAVPRPGRRGLSGPDPRPGRVGPSEEGPHPEIGRAHV